MAADHMVRLWVRTGLVWFLVGISAGLYLGLSDQFQYSSAHAHVGLLGWLSSIGFAVVHRVALWEGMGARGHWVLHNLGTATMVTGLYLVVRQGGGPIGMVIALGGFMVIAAGLWLVSAVWGKLGQP